MLLLWIILIAAVSGKCADEEESDFFSMGDGVDRGEEVFYDAKSELDISVPVRVFCVPVL